MLPMMGSSLPEAAGLTFKQYLLKIFLQYKDQNKNKTIHLEGESAYLCGQS